MNDPNNLPAEHGAAVWLTICRLLGTREAADCFQETFVQYARIARRQPVAKPLGLLKRLATMRAVDEIRRRSADRQRHRPLDQTQLSGESEPWQNAAAQELDDQLRVALAEIAEDQAAVFCMTQLEGMDRSETAVAMGISVENVSVLLHRARAALQGKLAKYLPKIERRS